MPSFQSPSGFTFEYETLGKPGNPAALFIMGFTAQLTAWPVEFMQRFVDAGLFVVRFDNRDCGLSSKLDHISVDMTRLMSAALTQDVESIKTIAPYTLSDMAADAVSVLDHLEIESAHIIGASMGGMIAQTVAIEHPMRTRTLTSIMSTTGEPEFGQSAPEAQAALLTPSPIDREGYIASSENWAIWSSKKYVDLDVIRKRAADSYDRSFYPAGASRQLAAIVASGSRREGLEQIRIPTLVLHGTDDTLITPTGGQRTSELVPGASFLLAKDMGHDLPEPLWPLITGAILGNIGLAL